MTAVGNRGPRKPAQRTRSTAGRGSGAAGSDGPHGNGNDNGNGTGNGENGDRNGAKGDAGNGEVRALARHLGYVHREAVRLRLSFIVWLIEIALLQMEQNYPHIKADLTEAKRGFKF